MYQMLIAEDDRFAIEGLRSEIHWEKYNIKVAACCINGEEALREIRRRPIDILLTDIKMPKMDGLELAREVLAMGKGTRIVIVSGYGEFSYAQQALKMGVFDYLLKPVTLDKIESVFSRLLQDMDAEKMKLAGNLKQWKPALEQKYYQDLFSGVESPAQLPEELCGRYSYYQIAVFHIDHLSLLEPEKQKTLVSELYKLLSAVEEKGFHRIPLITGERNPSLFFLFFQRSQESDAGWLLRECQRQISDRLSVTVTIGVSRIYRHLAESRERLGEARFAVRQKCCMGDGRLLYFEQLRPKTELDETQLAKEKAVLIGQLRRLELEKAVDTLDTLAQFLSSRPFLDPQEAEHLCLELHSVFLSSLPESISFAETEDSRFESFSSSLHHCETLEEMFQLLRSEFYAVNASSESAHGKNHHIVMQVLRYIQENINTNISLAKIAKDVYLSPNYLGCIFKEEMKIGFNEYLIQYRMELAKKLLRSGKYKIYEVASMVGYKNPNYFSRLFTEYTGGIYPSDFY